MKVLDQLAIEILTQLEKNRELHVILPSERAKRYLLNALFRQNKGPMLAPNIQTIDQHWIKLCRNLRELIVSELFGRCPRVKVRIKN